jgi:hypothetical protein
VSIGPVSDLLLKSGYQSVGHCSGSAMSGATGV